MHTKHMFFFNLTRQIRDKGKDVEEKKKDRIIRGGKKKRGLERTK